MGKEIFRLDAGILLDKNDPEFECYNNVYTKEFGFYDEWQSLYLDYGEAKKDADDYIKDGVNKTYAVISSDGEYDIEHLFGGGEEYTEGEKYSILNETYYCTKISYSEDCIDYFAYKDNGEIKTIIDGRTAA